MKLSPASVLTAAKKRIADLEAELAVSRREVESLREEGSPRDGSRRRKQWRHGTRLFDSSAACSESPSLAATPQGSASGTRG